MRANTVGEPLAREGTELSEVSTHVPSIESAEATFINNFGFSPSAAMVHIETREHMAQICEEYVTDDESLAVTAAMHSKRARRPLIDL